MKAMVFHGIGDIRLDDVPDPKIQQQTDAIIRLSTSAICGTDLHFVRGTVPGMKPGTILGHEGVGVVEEARSLCAICNRATGSSLPPRSPAAAAPTAGRATMLSAMSLIRVVPRQEPHSSAARN